MKTILLIAFAAFIGFSGYAQDKSYSCSKKTVYHHKIYKKSVASKRIHTQPAAKWQPGICSTYAGPLLDACAPYLINGSCVYNTSGLIENSFTGNYPPSMDVTASTPSRSLMVTSSAFKNFGALPSKYTCEGQQASPPLTVTDIPEGTQSLAVVMYDPEANQYGSETYWLMWDLDTTGVIPENFVNNHESLNVAGEYGYHAVCPLGSTHYYHFMVYALDTKFHGNRHTTRADLERAMRGHVLAKGELVGTYERL